MEQREDLDSFDFPEVDIKSRAGRIKCLAHLVQAKHYLEVGVFQGETFNALDCFDRKVAVDPNFRFQTSEFASEGKVEFHEIPSDEYFSGVKLSGEKFDLIYLDGLHTFEQTFRDFCNASHALAEGGVILIDDTWPENGAQAWPNQGEANSVREAFSDPTRRWMGDTFKAVFAIHDYFPTWSFRTFPGHGQTVCWPTPRPSFQPFFTSMAELERCDFMRFVLVRDQLMRRGSYHSVFESVSGYTASCQGARKP